MVLICSRSWLWSCLVKVLTDLFTLTLIHAWLKSSLTYVFGHALLKSSLTFVFGHALLKSPQTFVFGHTLLKSSLTFADLDTNSCLVQVTVVYFTTDPRVVLCWAGSQACPNEWTSFDGSCYILGTELLPWADAEVNQTHPHTPV